MNPFDPIRLFHGGHQAAVAAHGAHVLAYQPEGQAPVLWLSPQAVYKDGKAIRGGVPVCAPWFGPHPTQPDGPAHGTVRTQAWDVLDQSDEQVSLGISSLSWRFKLKVALTDELQVSLTAINLANRPRDYSVALHTYLAVGDIRQTTVDGLDGKTYIDQLQDAARATQSGSIGFEAETDRIYLHAPGPVTVNDPVLQRRIVVSKRGSQSTVVWNPWVDKAARLSDFPDAAWPQMLCIEAANAADNTLMLEPEQAHTIATTIRAEPL